MTESDIPSVGLHIFEYKCAHLFRSIFRLQRAVIRPTPHLTTSHSISHAPWSYMARHAFGKEWRPATRCALDPRLQHHHHQDRLLTIRYICYYITCGKTETFAKVIGSECNWIVQPCRSLMGVQVKSRDARIAEKLDMPKIEVRDFI